MPNNFINQSQLAGAAAVACSDLLADFFVIWLLIQILIANVSGQSLDDGKTVCHARHNNANRNAQNKKANRQNMSPSTRWLTQPIQTDERQRNCCEATTSNPV